MTSILLHSYIYAYYKRYFWQLSSLLEQIPCDGSPVPDIKIVCSVHKDDPYFEWTEIIKETFGDKLNFQFDVWEDEKTFARRGWVRDKWLKACDTEWLIFNDGDMTYDPQFFAHLATVLPANKGKTQVIGTPRYTMSIEDGYKLVDSETYDKPIANAAEKCKVLSPTMSNSGNICGAGFFQCVDAKAVQALGINYVDGKHDTSVFSGVYRTVSDKVFRYKVKGYTKFRHAKPSYHINHKRKSDEGMDSTRPILH